MHTIERSWVENVEDGILMPRGVDNPADAKLTLRSSYVRYIRDDSIEADGCFHNVIDDVLVDEGHMMFAARPSKGGQYSGVAPRKLESAQQSAARQL